MNKQADGKTLAEVITSALERRAPQGKGFRSPEARRQFIDHLIRQHPNYRRIVPSTEAAAVGEMWMESILAELRREAGYAAH